MYVYRNNLHQKNKQFVHIKVQRRATRIILPDHEYNERLEMLCIPGLAKFLHEL